MTRVWTLHETLLNFRISDSHEIRSLLSKAIQSRNYVRSNDGVRFIVFLFTLSPGFVEDIHDAVKKGKAFDEKSVFNSLLLLLLLY